MTIDAPVSAHAYGKPQALAWNIGTTGMTRSPWRTPMPSARHLPSAWSMLDRCE